MKKWQGFVVLLIILACLAGLVWYSYGIIMNTVNKTGSGDIKLGLDLSGGVSVTYEIVDENPTKEEIDDTIKKMEERAASYNSEYSVHTEGENRITVEIPGVTDAEAVLADLGSPGSLYFIKQTDADGNENYSFDSATGEYVLNGTIEEMEAKGAVVMDGNSVAEAAARYQQDSQLGNEEPVVALTLTSEGAKAFGDATSEAYTKGETIGIYYDDHFISVPRVQAAITDGQAVITGMEDYEAAQNLATFIRVGAINLTLAELQHQVVGASLGTQALSTSLLAAGIGILIVMVFMIIVYGVMGVAASVALGLYTGIVVSLIYLFRPAPDQPGIVLTLPGIAGVILGIGMAVDANVIIFARIREETAKGATVHTAIRTGYKKALSAIVDGNVTTFIAAVVLHFLGSGAVVGFADTLMISILVSMFTALVVARLVNYSIFAMGVQDVKFYGKAKERKPIRFIEKRKVLLSISLIVILAGFAGMIGFGASGNKPLNYGIDFQGGTAVQGDLGRDITVEEIDTSIKPKVAEIIGSSDIQATTITGTTEISIRTQSLTSEQADAVTDMLISDFGVDENSIEVQTIGSTISGEMRSRAIIAVIVACICMLIYIWFRFRDLRMATSSILALVHDVLVVLTAYALIRITVGNTFIACMLTIVGYSINDTIVIFDRIRENLKSVRTQTRESLRECANLSLTQTIGRSLNTSITTFIMVLMLYILGVPAIRDFSLPLMVGFISGTYSSICIAVNLWYIMKTRKMPKEAKTAK
ncbi:MAG: protein translocase subunit SecD [Lachnospiraceae bacterium]|nr:protein translocase subunit SecD [Lachnospiraceae bacterium]